MKYEMIFWEGGKTIHEATFTIDEDVHVQFLRDYIGKFVSGKMIELVDSYTKIEVEIKQSGRRESR